MVQFIDDYRNVYGVEPICRVIPIASSTYYAFKARQADPSLRSARTKRDEKLKPEIQRVWDQNHQVYGAEKVWKQLNREDITVARCTVARLMREMGLEGVVRGPRCRTTVPAQEADCPLDLVERTFTDERPNRLWVSDLTYVATWSGFVYTAFVIDAFSRRIVGWRTSHSLRSDLALDALEQAIWEREEASTDGLIHHSDRGVQYLSIRYSERLAKSGIEPSVGSRGDSYDKEYASYCTSLRGWIASEPFARLRTAWIGPWGLIESPGPGTAGEVGLEQARLVPPVDGGGMDPEVLGHFRQRPEAAFTKSHVAAPEPIASS